MLRLARRKPASTACIDDQRRAPAQRLQLLRQLLGLGRRRSQRPAPPACPRPASATAPRSARAGAPSSAGRSRGRAPPGRAPRRRCGTAARAGCPGGRCRCPSACTASSWCPETSPMPLVLCVPARRLASCQCTTRAMMSGARLVAEDLVRQLERAGAAVVERGDRRSASSFPSAPAGASSSAAGYGASAGRARLTASRTST